MERLKRKVLSRSKYTLILFIPPARALLEHDSRRVTRIVRSGVLTMARTGLRTVELGSAGYIYRRLGVGRAACVILLLLHGSYICMNIILHSFNIPGKTRITFWSAWT